MKKTDAMIIGGLLVLCAALFLLFRLSSTSKGGELKAEIYVAGQLAQTIALMDGEARELSIENGKLILRVERDGVAVSFADCPNHVCQRTGKISLPGQMITCLPNRVIIRLVGTSGADTEVDAIAG